MENPKLEEQALRHNPEDDDIIEGTMLPFPHPPIILAWRPELQSSGASSTTTQHHDAEVQQKRIGICLHSPNTPIEAQHLIVGLRGVGASLLLSVVRWLGGVGVGVDQQQQCRPIGGIIVPAQPPSMGQLSLQQHSGGESCVLYALPSSSGKPTVIAVVQIDIPDGSSRSFAEVLRAHINAVHTTVVADPQQHRGLVAHVEEDAVGLRVQCTRHTPKERVEALCGCVSAPPAAMYSTGAAAAILNAWEFGRRSCCVVAGVEVYGGGFDVYSEVRSCWALLKVSGLSLPEDGNVVEGIFEEARRNSFKLGAQNGQRILM